MITKTTFPNAKNAVLESRRFQFETSRTTWTHYTQIETLTTKYSAQTAIALLLLKPEQTFTHRHIYLKGLMQILLLYRCITSNEDGT